MGKKKRSKARLQAENEAAKDELLALGSIFADDFRAHEDGHGFSLSVVPHPGEAAASFIAVELDIRYNGFSARRGSLPTMIRVLVLLVSSNMNSLSRYPPGYPSSELQLKIRNETGLAAEQKKSLSKDLHDLAAQFAEAGEVCHHSV